MARVVWKVQSSDAHPALRRWLSELPTLFPDSVTVTVASGGRSDAQQETLYQWGRTVRNPDMDRTGDPGPNGLGVFATNARTSADSAHGWKETSDGARYCAVDIDVVPGSRQSEVMKTCERFGLLWGGTFTVSGKPDVRHAEVVGWRSLRPLPGPSAGGSSALLLVGGLALAALVVGGKK